MPASSDELRLAGLDIADLVVAEQLMIWALRCRLEKGPSGPIIHGFHVAFGISTMEAALASFEAIFQALHADGRRDIGLHAPRCRHVSRDEMMVTTVIAMLQQDCGAKARHVASRLIAGYALDTFMSEVQAFATLLTRQGLHLPLRPWVLEERRDARLLH